MGLSKDAGASLKRKLAAFIEEELFADDIEVLMAQAADAGRALRHLDAADESNKSPILGRFPARKAPKQESRLPGCLWGDYAAVL